MPSLLILPSFTFQRYCARHTTGNRVGGQIRSEFRRCGTQNRRKGGAALGKYTREGAASFQFFFFVLKRCWWSFFGRTTGENDHHHRFPKKKLAQNYQGLAQVLHGSVPACSRRASLRSYRVGPSRSRQGVAHVMRGSLLMFQYTHVGDVQVQCVPR